MMQNRVDTENQLRLSPSQSKKLGMALALLMLAGAAYAIYWLISGILSLEREIATAILAGMITVLGSSLSFAISRYYEKSRDIEREIREKKVPIYTEFIEFMLLQILAPEDMKKEELGENELAKRLQDFNVKVLIWGSDDVVNEWINFRKALLAHEKAAKSKQYHFMPSELNTLANAIIPTGRFLLALRKDIGHRNKDLVSLRVMNLFITDLDDVMAKAIESIGPQDQRR